MVDAISACVSRIECNTRKMKRTMQAKSPRLQRNGIGVAAVNHDVDAYAHARILYVTRFKRCTYVEASVKIAYNVWFNNIFIIISVSREYITRLSRAYAVHESVRGSVRLRFSVRVNRNKANHTS